MKRVNLILCLNLNVWTSENLSKAEMNRVKGRGYTCGYQGENNININYNE
jgi:natural product precursor